MKRLLFGTFAGRAILAGLLVKAGAFGLRATVATVPAIVTVIDTAAGVLVAIGGVILLAAGLRSAKRRLVWRVRPKLIISYIFIGFVPAVLIVAFFILAGLLLFSNFSSYIVQTRLRTLADRAQSIAEATALEIQRGG